MIKFENVDVVGWEHAIRGMRNPMNSWDRSDSGWNAKYNAKTEKERSEYIEVQTEYDYEYHVGPNDQNLMMKLRNAGTDHRKFMRTITVYVDITAPLYWWKEFDTYKVGTVANSCSTMHKITEKVFTIEDFSCEHLFCDELALLKIIIDQLNENRDEYIDACRIYKDSDKIREFKNNIWWQMIQLLPSSYNQKRTIMMNYEVLANIYKSRKDHKLDEWKELCTWIESLPFSELITG